MQHPVSAPLRMAAANYADRIGFAQLTRRAFEGVDLHPLRDQLVARIAAGTALAGEGLDLSLITQLLGDKDQGLAIQSEVLSFHQLFRTPSAAAKPGLRLLALAADIDMGGNTPIDFLLEGSDVDLFGRELAEVEHDDLAVGREPHQTKTSPTNATRRRARHACDQSRGHRGVHGIAPRSHLGERLLAREHVLGRSGEASALRLRHQRRRRAHEQRNDD